MPLDGIQEDAKQLDLAIDSHKIKEIVDEIQQKTYYCWSLVIGPWKFILLFSLFLCVLLVKKCFKEQLNLKPFEKSANCMIYTFLPYHFTKNDVYIFYKEWCVCVCVCIYIYNSIMKTKYKSVLHLKWEIWQYF